MNDKVPPSDQQTPQRDQYAIEKPDPEEDLFVWTAPNRPFKKRNREFFTTVFLIVFLVSLILFFANQFLPIAVVLALGFLTYVLSSVPPEMIENKLTTYGIHTGTHMAYWFDMGRYWYTKRYNTYILHVETAGFPYRMMLLFTEKEKAEIEKHMDKYLIKETPVPTAWDKTATWLQEKIPLDKEDRAPQTSEPAQPTPPTQK